MASTKENLEVPQRLAKDAAIATFVVCFALLVLGFLTGTADVEESANSSYSAGAAYSRLSPEEGRFRVHTVAGVPVFDSLQGTGDRLPYQSSWGQSVSWPIRYLVGWELYSQIRSLLFAFPSVYVCLRVLQSWIPRASKWMLIVFGVLINSTYGLYLRQNDWSDHYVQTLGICAVLFLMLHRAFHDSSTCLRDLPPPHVLICLFISLNGVATGHPGYWPLAFFVWSSFLAVFLMQRTFRNNFTSWLKPNFRAVLIGSTSLVLSIVAVVWDLLSELKNLDWTAGRFSRTPGLFSQYAFGGVYGLSDGGVLPEPIRHIISAILGTTVMPAFVAADSWIPAQFRASDFRELPRVEFSGSLVLVAVALSWRALRAGLLRRVLTQILMAQALIWISVIASVLDAVPAVLTTSGIWMTLPVLLAVNVLVSCLLIHQVPRRHFSSSGLAVVNLLLAGYWFLIQTGFASFGGILEIPERFESRFKQADVVSQSHWHDELGGDASRILLSGTPSIYDSLAFLTLGIPVVAPADPKMRSSGQLQSNFAFNFSINSPRFEGMTAIEIEKTLDFLQVEYVLLGDPTRSDAPPVPPISEGLRDTVAILPEGRELVLSDRRYQSFARSEFSAFVIDSSRTKNWQECAILFSACAVATESKRVDTAPEPKLELCEQRCLWLFRAPALASTEMLIIPITYDESLEVSDANDMRLETSNISGFLGVGSENGVKAGVISVALDPDIRMLSRVFVSYVNLGVVLVLLGAVLQPWVQSRRRRLRIE